MNRLPEVVKFASLVKSLMLPSVKVPVATNFPESPLANVSGNDSERDTNSSFDIVIFVVLFIPLKTAVKVELP